MGHHLDHPSGKKRDAEKPAGHASEVACEQEVTRPRVQENEQGLERLLLRYLRIYETAGSHSSS